LISGVKLRVENGSPVAKIKEGHLGDLRYASKKACQGRKNIKITLGNTYEKRDFVKNFGGKWAYKRYILPRLTKMGNVGRMG
jgi:hypothetical protein